MPPNLELRRDFFADPAAHAAYATLLRAVFDLDVAARDRICGRMPDTGPLAYFTPEGACVASVEAFRLALRLDGRRQDVAAIRSVTVAPQWRGRGLFRALMGELLTWCDSRFELILLYAAEPALYTPFGFASVAQHKRAGASPPAAQRPGGGTRRLDLGQPADAALMRRLLACRAPVSDHVAVEKGASLFLEASGDLILDYSPALDAVIASDADSDSSHFILVDVVAATIPPLAAVIDALPGAPRTVEVLFPTDKLEWRGASEPDDTGLMARGRRPAAFDQPFMLPPTTEF